MPKNSAKYFNANKIKEIELRRSNTKDYFDRLVLELGKRSNAQGQPLYTTFKLWCHPPVINHPEFYIKMQMSNGAGPPTFTSLYIHEFDQWLEDVIKWRKDHDDEIKLGVTTSMEIKRRRHINTSIGNILNDTSLPTTAIELAIEEKYTEEDIQRKSKPPEIKAIYDLEKLKQSFLYTYNAFVNTPNENTALKNFYFNALRELIPDDIESFKKLREMLSNIPENSEDISIAYEELLEPYLTKPEIYDNIPFQKMETPESKPNEILETNSEDTNGDN